MKLALTLPTDLSLALRKFAAAEKLSLEDAGALAMREFLILSGDLEYRHELDEDTETAGEA